MRAAYDVAELLVRTATTLSSDCAHRGLREREWTSLRFLSRANRFSRNATALASFIGATRPSVTQIVKTLESKSYIVREPARQDRRRLLLNVTPLGKQTLREHDPIKHLVDVFSTIGSDDCERLGRLMRQALNRAGVASGICGDCAYLTQHGRATPGRPDTKFSCRLYRADISIEESGELCAGFDINHDRSHLEQLVYRKPVTPP